MNWRVIGSVVTLASMLFWGIWLISQAKTKSYYVKTRAAGHAALQRCAWTPIDSPSVANLGFSIDSGHAWSDRSTAYLAFPIKAVPAGGWLDLDIISVVGGNVFLEVEGGVLRYVVRNPGKVRLAVPTANQPRTLLVRMSASDPLPPSGEERRWLGAAVSRLRVCDS